MHAPLQTKPQQVAQATDKPILRFEFEVCVSVSIVVTLASPRAGRGYPDPCTARGGDKEYPPLFYLVDCRQEREKPQRRENVMEGMIPHVKWLANVPEGSQTLWTLERLARKMHD